MSQSNPANVRHKTEQRQTNECDFAQRDGESRIAVLVLTDGITAKQEPRENEEGEENHHANEEEFPVQISTLRIKRCVRSRQNVHPVIKMMPQEQHRDEENCKNGKKSDKIFELSPNDYGPLRIGRVMHDDPEKAAGENREVKCKTEQPGETELPRRQEPPDHAQSETNDRDHSEQRREPGETTVLEIFALRRWGIVQAFAHFFAASGVGAGFVSAGLSKSARCSDGTSVAVVF